ncbi:hypothetical protein BKP35_11215 [Anaerobacillus arseniciselenatis]|uniref:Uncharacterized protein n=1 Tax=Anaerobacillus arseniciselenatis TaxID=85682 RepID=A0A1S2LK62_9BACI|nr:hypothetical protein BKP35_11215 [Anaerobacillus arseniciselenatis]
MLAISHFEVELPVKIKLRVSVLLGWLVCGLLVRTLVQLFGLLDGGGKYAAMMVMYEKRSAIF